MNKKVCVDLGHGGNDSGAVAFGVAEKNIVLGIGGKLKNILAKYPITVAMTRESDLPPWGNLPEEEDLQHRVDRSNLANADLFVSLHVDSFPNAEGFATWIYTTPMQLTEQYAQIMHKHVAKYYKDNGLGDRGVHNGNFMVLRETNAPALLLENLFITNKKDEIFLSNEIHQGGIAEAIAEGIAEILGIQESPVMTPYSPPYIPSAPEQQNPETLPVLQKGSTGDMVKKLQELLDHTGSTLQVDGIFGDLTRNAVMHFQVNNGLVIDGIVGKYTWSKILGR